jgi:lysophospholipase L1-like esterase
VTRRHPSALRLRPLLVLVASVALALSVSTGVTAGSAAAAPARGPSVLIVGGTLTSRFTDDAGTASQGWWSIAAARVGATSVTVSAEGGSSITSAGNRCQGTTFGQRLPALKKVDILIIEVGSDNHLACTAHGRRTLTSGQSRHQIRRYVNQVAARVDALHIPRSHVFFVSPRGSKSGRRSTIVRAHVKKAVHRRHSGFRFIETPRLRTRETIDGVQPNRAGNAAIGQAVVVAVARTARAARTTAPTPPTGRSMMVVGDSITSWYSDEPGSRSQGWWSMLGRRLGATSIRTSAEGGSGVNVRGNQCTGTTFGERLSALRRVDVLVIEVGRNDYKTCPDDPRFRMAAADAQQLGMGAYARALSARVAELGMRPDQVWFVTPWGVRDETLAEPMRDTVRRAVTAPAIGFGFVDTPILAAGLTLDGIHPNLVGNQVLSDAVHAAMLAPRTRPEPAPDPAPAPEPEAVLR